MACNTGFGTPAQLLCERKATVNCLRYGARMTKLPHLMLLIFAALTAIPALAESDLRLVVQITVDQLRGDTMSRFHDNFSKRDFGICSTMRFTTPTPMIRMPIPRQRQAMHPWQQVLIHEFRGQFTYLRLQTGHRKRRPDK